MPTLMSARFGFSVEKSGEKSGYGCPARSSYAGLPWNTHTHTRTHTDYDRLEDHGAATLISTTSLKMLYLLILGFG